MTNKMEGEYRKLGALFRHSSNTSTAGYIQRGRYKENYGERKTQSKLRVYCGKQTARGSCRTLAAVVGTNEVRLFCGLGNWSKSAERHHQQTW